MSSPSAAEMASLLNSTSSTLASEVSDDAFFVNKNDIHGNPLVSEVLTGRKNFVSWRKAMEIALSARDKLEFVEGEIPMPTEAKQKAKWKRCNNVIMTWILNSVSKNVVGQILHSENVAIAWKSLNMKYGGSNISRKFSVQQEIANLMQGDLDVSSYHEKLVNLWHELDSMRRYKVCVVADGCVKCQETKDFYDQEKEEGRVIKFLMGLNEAFTHIRTHILALRELPSLDVAYDMVSTNEAERSIAKAISIEASAMYAHQESSYKQQNQFQRSAGNSTGNSAGNSVGRVKQRPYCTHCQFNGHTKEHCYKLNGYPPGHRLYKGKNQNKSANNVTLNAAEATQKSVVGTNSQAAVSSSTISSNSFTTEQVNQIWNMIKQQQQGTTETVEGQCHMAGICSLVLHSLVKHSWIVDSGATDHFICDKSLLKNVYELPKKCHISLPDGNTIVVSSAGTYELRPGLVLHDVMFASEFKYNLLSVSKLVKDTSYSVIFNKDQCLIQDSARRTVLEIGRMAGGLFQVEDQSLNKKVNSAVNNKVSAQTWHHGLGHMSFERMNTFLPKYIPYLPIKPKWVHCGVCPLAKQSRLKFTLSEHISTDIFDMIHCDVWGPFPIETMSGAQYFLTIVDDKSRCVWTYLMKKKSEVADLLIQFFAMVVTQFAKRIKVLRSDNGGEFFSTRLSSFLSLKGCVHQSSCAYTPQQNGVVERKHRHILDVARALRIQANVPKTFWGDCVLTATYILNRTPTPFLDGRTPSEILFGFPPSLDHMRVFGCLCYVHTPPKFRDKLDPRASPCIFLGYPYGKKAYKVYCLTSHKVLVSRDVHFYENIFPFQVKSPDAESNSSSVVPLVTNWTRNVDNLPPEMIPSAATDDVFYDSVDNTNDDQLLNEVGVPVEGESNSTNIEGESNSSTNANNTQDSHNNNIDSYIGSQMIDTIPVRRSQRHVKRPGWLKDYQCNALLNTSSPHSMDKQVTYGHCSPAHAHFLGLISLHKEPTSYIQASKDELWRTAMQKEITALEHNQTWTLTHLPVDKRAVECKWVFKIKHHSDGTIERYKARLVAKGFTQVEGIDYHETFAPVVKMTTVRCVLAVAAVRQWPLYQLDVNNAFLHGHLDEDVYMKLPPGFYPQAKKDGLVCKLQRSLYGLKQASRQWFSRFSDALVEYGFLQSANDSSLFTLAQQDDFIILLVYVDDVVLTGTSSQLITRVKEFIHEKFQIKDLGYLKYFLGLEVARSQDGIFLNQRKYALDILEDTNFSECKPIRTPMESKHGLSLSSGPPLPDPSIYRRLVGRLIYLTITRPDLAFPVHVLSQYMQTPTEDHLRAAHRVLRYIKSAPSQGLLFSSSSSFDLAGYCDADWASCPLTRRSVSGYCMMLGSSVLSWKTKKQAVVARSSAESEYRALAGACGEVLWLVRLLGDMRVHVSPPVPIHCDNQAAIHIARNPVFHERTKHVEIDCHFVRHHVNAGSLNPIFIGTHDQPADLFTKPLSSDRLHYLSSKLGVSNFLHNPA
ncbi:unnamed protein product [Rhodiola kirilowii]